MNRDRKQRKAAERPDDPAQSRDFMKVARELGADQESKADDVIERLAKRPPDPRGKKRDFGN